MVEKAETIKVRSHQHPLLNFFFFAQGLERDVASQTSQKLEALGETAKAVTHWEVDVHTGSLRGAGCDAVVSIVLHGENGTSSAPIMLDNDPYNCTHTSQQWLVVVFSLLWRLVRKGRVDKFQLHVKEALEGRLKSITIGHDCSGFSPAWYLERVSVRNYQHDEKHFVAAQWLDGDTATISLNPVDKLVLPAVVDYAVEVVTGDRFGAGTSANVRLELVGADRKAVRELETPVSGPNNTAARSTTVYCSPG